MSIEAIKTGMKVDKVFTDHAWHPPRRRVKFMPVTRTRDESGKDVVVDNSDWVGQYPILWSRSIGNGERMVIMLIDDERGLTAHGTLSDADYEKLPETEIEW